jgi:hypothetical protein
MKFDPKGPFEPKLDDPASYMECRFDLKEEGIYVHLNDLARYFGSRRWEGTVAEGSTIQLAQLLLDLEKFFTDQKAFLQDGGTF